MSTNCGTAEVIFWIVSGILLVVLTVIGVIELTKPKTDDGSGDGGTTIIKTDKVVFKGKQQNRRSHTLAEEREDHEISAADKNKNVHTEFYNQPVELNVEWNLNDSQPPKKPKAEPNEHLDQLFHDSNAGMDAFKSIDKAEVMKKTTSAAGFMQLSNGEPLTMPAKLRARNVGTDPLLGIRPKAPMPTITNYTCWNSTDASWAMAKGE